MKDQVWIEAEGIRCFKIFGYIYLTLTLTPNTKTSSNPNPNSDPDPNRRTSYWHLRTDTPQQEASPLQLLLQWAAWVREVCASRL